jgi:sirohydrochlorin cobaltochelatase
MRHVTQQSANDNFRLILFVHGSRDPRWRRPFEELTAGIQADVGRERVRLAYMEFAAPTLMDAAEGAVHDGVSRLRLFPIFLAGGAHVDRDIPEQISAVRARFPGLEIEVLPPVGEDPRFASLLRAIAVESTASSRTHPDGPRLTVPRYRTQNAAYNSYAPSRCASRDQTSVDTARPSRCRRKARAEGRHLAWSEVNAIDRTSLRTAQFG